MDDLAAVGALVAVVRGGQLLVSWADGRPILRLGDAAAPMDDPPDAHRAEDVRELYGVPEEDSDEDYAEELVDDDVAFRRRHLPRANAAPDRGETRSNELASSRDGLWIVARGELWHVDLDGHPRRAGRLPADLHHLAVDWQGHLIVAQGASLLVSGDEGATFSTLSVADAPVRFTAAAPDDGRIAWATDARLFWRIGLDAPVASTVLPGPPQDLAFCGDALLVLHSGGLLAMGAGGGTRLPVRARRLACGPHGEWILVGRPLVWTRDGGAHFQPVPAATALPPHSLVQRAAGTANLLWVGDATGLHALPWVPAEGELSVTATPSFSLPPAAPSSSVAWARWLPRVSLAASSFTTAGRQDLRAVAYADFPLSDALPAPARARLVVTQSTDEASPVTPIAPLRTTTAYTAPVDAEATCLPVVRSKAVLRALAEPERARSLVARAGHAAWLPELRVRMDRRLGRSESLDLPAGTTSVAGPLGLDTANDVRYEARATWDLSRLVFSSDEIAAAAQALRMADMRRDIESLANRLYFERRRLKLESPASTADPAARLRQDLRVHELEAELDALSGGAFSRCLTAPPKLD